MRSDQSSVRGINPKVTEQFLLTQPAVVDASVWFSNGDMVAHVTVLDEVNVTRRALQAACLMELGVHQTPRDIMFLMARPKAA